MTTKVCKSQHKQYVYKALSLSLRTPLPAIQAREPGGEATMHMYIEVYVLWYVST